MTVPARWPDLNALTLPELRSLDAALRAAIRTALHTATGKETTMTLMSKSDLIKAVASATGIKVTTAADAVDAALHLIRSAAEDGHGYRLTGFGTFAPKTRAARTGRNPQTGLPVEIPARTALTFKPAKTPKAGA